MHSTNRVFMWVAAGPINFPLQYDRLLNQQQKNNQTKQLQKCADEIQTLPSMLHENLSTAI